MRKIFTCCLFSCALSAFAAPRPVVRVVPGADVQRALDAAPDGAEIRFAAGDYPVDSELVVTNRRDLLVRGETGARFVIRFEPVEAKTRTAQGFVCRDLKGITFENLVFTTDRPVNCNGTVVAIDAAHDTYDVEIDEGFPIDTRQVFAAANSVGADGAPSAALECQGETPYEIVGPRTIRAQGPRRTWAPNWRYDYANLKLGQRIVYRFLKSGRHVFLLSDCEDMVFRDITVERSASFVVRIRTRSRNATFERFVVRAPAGAREILAGNADGIHVEGLSGELVLKDCHFRGLGDDALNVHALAGFVKAYDPATGALDIRRRSRRTGEGLHADSWARTGDEIVVYDPKTFLEKGRFVLDGHRKGRGRVTNLTGTLAVDDVLANRAFYPKVTVSGCTFENSRARGILLQSQDMLIENSRFAGHLLAGLLIAPDIRTWNEVGPAKNVEIRNNEFTRCGTLPTTANLGALVIKASHDVGSTEYPAGVHENISIHGNDFHDNGTRGIYVSAVKGLDIRDNRFARNASAPDGVADCPDVRTVNCETVAAALAARAADESFAPALFWWWNAKLDAKALCAQVDDFYDHGFRTLCIHPFPKGFRPTKFPCDMEPDYLTDGYLDIYAAVTDHAAEKGMVCWLYDEGGWPSGGACGQVVVSDPVRFAIRRMERGKDGGATLIVEKYDPCEKAPYPSVIEPGATDRFLELTHERLKSRVGRHFGKAVPWVFTDEPSAPHGYDRLGWSTDFAREFRARKGYDVTPFLTEMLRKGHARAEVRRARVDYYDVMADLFVERYLLPCRDWCRANGLFFGGHLDGDDDIRNALTHGHGSLLRSLRAMDLPGVDCIWRQIHPNSSYTAFPRLASSAAHQTGARRVLSETFAIYGETLSPVLMKRTVDFQLVRGVNQFVFAFACQSTAGRFMSLGDPHFGPCDPKWPFMSAFNAYVRDASARLAAGTNPVRVAVYWDVRSVWAEGFGGGEAVAAAQSAVARGLDVRQVDFDFVDDDLIEAGRLPYAAVVFPTDGGLSEKGKTAIAGYRARGGLTLGPDELDRAPRTCRASGSGAESLRVTKRLLPDGTADYFLVNEGDRAIAPSVAFDEGATRTVALDPCGSAFVRLAADGRVQEAPPVRPAIVARRELKDGWTVRKAWAVRPGAADFEYPDCSAESERPCVPGDWGTTFGTNFSGRAVYRVAFVAEGDRAELDLGKVGVCAAARLNGRELEPRFAPPFRWEVSLAVGTNVLEVTVANTLANALVPTLGRIGRDFPPKSSWSFREEAFYARDDFASGLIGPVTLGFTAEGR